MQSFDIKNFHWWTSKNNKENYELGILSKMKARRTTEVGRIALDLALKTIEEEKIDFIVYSSRHGEVLVSYEMISSILEKEIPSPMKFSSSTHNAVVGQLSILTKNPAATTAISAGKNSFIMGLLSSLSYLKKDPSKKILYLFADAKIPEIYEKQLSEENENIVISMLLTDGESHFLEQVESGEDLSENQGLEFIHWFSNREPSKKIGHFSVRRIS